MGGAPAGGAAGAAPAGIPVGGPNANANPAYTFDFGGNAPPNPASFGAGGGAAPSGEELETLLRASPFGQLVDVIGVDGVVNAFGGGTAPAEGEVPAAAAEAATLGGSAAPVTGAAPVAEAVPVIAAAPAAEVSVAAPESSEELDALLAASPFGGLLNIPGVDTAEDVFGEGNAGSGSPFAQAGATAGVSTALAEAPATEVAAPAEVAGSEIPAAIENAFSPLVENLADDPIEPEELAASVAEVETYFAANVPAAPAVSAEAVVPAGAMMGGSGYVGDDVAAMAESIFAPLLETPADGSFGSEEIALGVADIEALFIANTPASVGEALLAANAGQTEQLLAL